jgi:Reverse transcriptase (RNA-dependent DNA polymerase)
VHANKLRPYEVRVDALQCDLLCYINDDCDVTSVEVNNCSIVYENDLEFGPIRIVESRVAEASNLVQPSKKIDDCKLSHLTNAQRIELFAVLDKYPECFSETPGFCGQLGHDIIVSPEFRPKRLRAYKIPEKLRPAVDQQLQELLKLGFIRQSKSPLASALICIIKRDKSVRCVADNRYLNGYTVPDALGPPDMQSVLQRIGRATYITIFDGKSSYWTIPIKKQHQWLTGFTTGDQLYEWTGVPFGLQNSGSSFVRMLQKVLYPIREFACSYVDDLDDKMIRVVMQGSRSTVKYHRLEQAFLHAY